ncbi:4-hydroxy-tetrahydrodipicolinate reductase [Chlamydiifrater volucris]|uniref:4-hydroxy-tetrahydrodipicolinate reductase n=1 Tax=Chlamydiifrater volucris TaxID=2681470 RepID=UPI001BCD10EE|nr:dihydrodipicolinate reductase C-terminal domain-containing protein [Chlamydiifrater volucris]
MKKVIGILGITGKAGSSVAHHIKSSSQFCLGKGVGRRFGSPYPLGSLQEVVLESDFLIDFSSPDLVKELLIELKEHPKPLAICTTNLELCGGEIVELVETVSRKSQIIIAPNVSFGACLQSFLVSFLTKVLDDKYDIHIRDEHHRSKKDAVSGTAKALVKSIIQEKKEHWNLDYNYGFPQEGGRPDHYIELSSSRSGGILGRHNVSFTNFQESLSVVHEVFDRSAFTYGVEKILGWMEKNMGRVGVYDMADVFGLKKHLFGMK